MKNPQDENIWGDFVLVGEDQSSKEMPSKDEKEVPQLPIQETPPVGGKTVGGILLAVTLVAAIFLGCSQRCTRSTFLNIR